MKLFRSLKWFTKLGNVLLALCLLALNSGPVSKADALTTQENNTTAAITSEPHFPGFIKGTQLVGTNTAFPSASNEDDAHLRYAKQTGMTNFIGVPSSKSMMKNISAAAPVIKNRILINFSPYIDGQNPNSGTDLPESQILERMQIIAPYSKWIRTFSCGNGLEVIGGLAHEMNLQVAVNAWIGPSDVDNQQQITCLINQANAGHVDLAIVGSEALLRGDVTPDVLMSYIDQVRQAIPLSIPVTTADVYTSFLGNPLLVDHIDLIFTNIYPFWEGYEIQDGIAMLNYYYNQLVETYPTKTIKISETGWPSCGSFHDAIGSLENEARYFSQVDTWARDKNVTVFYFDGLDESWKALYEGPQGACWGIWDKNGVMKEGMSSVFDGTGASFPYDLTLPSTCDTDEFSFNFTSVPPYGSFDNVQGQTCGIFDKNYKIMLYIKVDGNWWVKPYFNQATTSINPNGTWSVDYTTGGIDQTATEIRAYLIPTNKVGSCNAITDSCGYLMISATRPTDPNAFDKSSPANGATNQSINPTLSWGSSTGVISYEYCYDTTDDGTCSNWTNNGTATTTVLSGLDPVTTYYWHVRGTTDLGIYYSNNTPDAFWSFTTTQGDVSPPTISNITRLNINPADTNNVNFTVTFSESVTGIDTTLPFSDFVLSTTGVTGATITAVSGSRATYTVTVNTGSGDGTIRLDAFDDDSIRDAADNPLGGIGNENGNFTGGEFYTIQEDITSPQAVSITRINPSPTNASSVGFTVSFSEPVLGVDESDFHLSATNDITGASITNISGSEENYTITVNTGIYKKLSSGLTDINTATPSELEALPAIGPTLAQRIVDYRTLNGPFFKIEDIMDVSGIGPATFERIKDLITIGGQFLRLDVLDDNSIIDSGNNPLGGAVIGDGDFSTGEAYSIVRSAAIPGIPVLLSPASAALVSDLQPALDWRDSKPAAHHYQVQVATNKTFTALVVNEANASSSTFTPPFDLTPGKLYYWRVKAFNVIGGASGWSLVRTFKTPLAQPVLVSPADIESLLTDRPSFDWNPVDGATQYNLQVSAAANFSTLLLNTALSTTEYTAINDLPQNKILHWRVRAKTSAVAGPWSGKWSFKTGNPPTVPVLVAPANGALVKDYTPALNWTNSKVPTGTAFKHYEVQMDDNKEFSSPETVTTTADHITDSEFTPSSNLASNTKFYWRVRAINSVFNLVTSTDEDHISCWSPVWSFRTVIPAPQSLLMTPNDLKPLQPSFSWDAATGVVSGYTIQMSTTSSFSTLLVNSTGSNWWYAMLKNLPAHKTIYWRVRINGTNGPSAWSKAQFVTP